MDFTFTTSGRTFDQLTRGIARDLTAAHKKAGRQIARKGKAAAAKGAPVMWGERLAVATDTEADANGCTVTFKPAAGNAGGWAMQESGTRPHSIAPRRGRGGRGGRPAALAFDGLYYADVFVSGMAGRRAWTRAGERIAKAANTVVLEVYSDALEGG